MTYITYCTFNVTAFCNRTLLYNLTTKNDMSLNVVTLYEGNSVFAPAPAPAYHIIIIQNQRQKKR